MLPEVEQNVGDRVADFARRRERARVITIAPYLGNACDLFDGEGDPDREALNSAHQIVAALSLDDRVHVVLLYREVKDAKQRALGARDRISDGREERQRAK